MENLPHISTNTSEDQLSFPIIIPVEEESFEFGCSQLIQDSPESPADYLFLNGKLQPHDFPTSSRSSSVRSIDSILSSRSNSTNSSCSSTRTSGSDSERKSPLSQRAKVAAGSRKNILSRKERSFWKQHYQQNKKPTLMSTDFSSSLRWQFITPMPDLISQSARIRKSQTVELERKENGNGAGARALFGCRAVRLFMTACLSCHAMHPAGADQ